MQIDANAEYKNLDFSKEAAERALRSAATKLRELNEGHGKRVVESAQVLG
jgi:hypothetical protein